MKEQLAQLIEVYAAARASGNATLQQFATQQLSTFLGSIEVIEAAPTSEPELEDG
jgi:hypothetical protein